MLIWCAQNVYYLYAARILLGVVGGLRNISIVFLLFQKNALFSIIIIILQFYFIINYCYKGGVFVVIPVFLSEIAADRYANVCFCFIGMFIMIYLISIPYIQAFEAFWAAHSF